MADLTGRRGKIFIIATLLFTLLVVFLQVGGHRVDRGVGVLAIPQRAIHWGISSIRFLIERYIALVNLKKENLRLEEEVRRLKRENAELKEAALSAERLERLLALKGDIPQATIAAQVIAASPSGWFNEVVIDKGGRDGVRSGMPVVTKEGAVGRVVRVSAGSSVVMLLYDRNSAVDCFVQRTRQRGIVQGVGVGRCYLRYVPREADIQIGDLLVASGLAGGFPKGFPVGVVVKVDKQGHGLFAQIEVVPCADLSRLEEVMVIASISKEA